MKKQKLRNIQNKIKTFNYALNYKKLNFRKHPSLYQIGRGEQGVLMVQPYKDEILPFWKFKTPEIAKASANKIYSLFLAYRKLNDFVGMDMARKFLQMGYTRSRRYANHKDGRKYQGPIPENHKGESGSHGRKQLELNPDKAKEICASYFYKKWQMVRKDPRYQKLKKKHIEKSTLKTFNKSSVSS